MSFGLQNSDVVYHPAPSERFVDHFRFTFEDYKTITCYLHLTHQRRKTYELILPSRH